MAEAGCADKTHMDRKTICFPKPGTQSVVHEGDPAFQQEVARLYDPSESTALERLIELKKALAPLPKDDYFTRLTEGLSTLIGADLTFVMKRILVDEQNAAIEMPPHGEPGSCMMAAAFHYCANDGSRTTARGSKFHAWGCPCQSMKHDKVFVIPDDLDNFITNNPNQLPTRCEAYIAVPLFAEGKCVAHFGAMWSKERAVHRTLSWAFIEALMHGLEDSIVARLTEGANFVRTSTQEKARIIPHDAVTIAQSLRPYAGSLSHELRTPMQGIVGMLDVMYATVQDAVEAQPDPRMRKIFEGLMENIEVVQDSSRRAIEAADNVVHAYDMDMSIPEGPSLLHHEDSNETMSPIQSEKRPEILVAGSNLPILRHNKRRREESSSRNGSSASQHKVMRLDGAASVWSRATSETEDAKASYPQADENAGQAQDTIINDPAPVLTLTTGSMRTIAPGLRHANLREVIQSVIDEGLKTGGRPDSVYATETEHGENIEVRSRGSDGTSSSKSIEWTIDPSVPHTMFIDEKDLSKLVSCVFLNAVKFTDNMDGKVTIRVTMSSRAKYISIKVGDNGPGIPAAFLPRLFKPFSQQNPSLTRPSEGLGLGLMVAKGIARKLEGDLICTKAETEGLRRGTEFEIKVPVAPGESISRPTSPFSSPRLQLAKHRFVENSEATPGSRSRTAKLSSSSVDRSLKSRNSPGLDATCHNCAEVISRRTGLDAPFPEVSPKSVRIAEPVAEPAEASSSNTASPPTDGESTFRPRVRKSVSTKSDIDRNLAARYPLTIMVVEDNKINRKLLVNMLFKLGYSNILEAHDGAEAVRQMSIPRPPGRSVDVVLMDLWMPLMDGYEATERILSVSDGPTPKPTVLAVTADVTDGALERAAQVGMTGFMTKPYKMVDLQRLIISAHAVPATA